VSVCVCACCVACTGGLRECLRATTNAHAVYVRGVTRGGGCTVGCGSGGGVCVGGVGGWETGLVILNIIRC
jgi:hypothetical protein